MKRPPKRPSAKAARRGQPAATQLPRAKASRSPQRATGPRPPREPAAPAPVLRVEALTKRYGAFTAVADLSFTLGEGEVVAFLGQNGAGKSTVIKMLCNLVRPSAGQAWLDGEPILGTRAAGHRRKLGAIVEAPRFYPHLSGRRNLELVARLLNAARDTPRSGATPPPAVPPQAVERMLEQVGLADRAHERFAHFSLGMKLRLGLAAAFLHRPRLVILDEPTGGLDPAGCARIHELIRALVREPGPGQARASVLLCTHQLAEAAAVCQRALVIERGRLVLDEKLGRPKGLAAVQHLFERLARSDKARGGAAQAASA
jgi:ABC-2 type transport system ATP-binding protein